MFGFDCFRESRQVQIVSFSVIKIYVDIIVIMSTILVQLPNVQYLFLSCDINKYPTDYNL